MRKTLIKQPASLVGGQARSASPKFMLKILGVAVGLTLGTLAHAVGLGSINVVSALGQPLKAEIELVAVSKADKSSLVARLASPDAYKGAGLEYPQGIKYSFLVENRANGDAYLKLSSNQEVNDPFVSLLVELSWSSGKLLREYTFLLDPPGYVAARPKAAEVRVVAPAALQSAPLTAVPVSQYEAAAPVLKPVKKAVEKQLAAAPQQNIVTGSTYVATGSINVKRGDTLNKIAAGIKPEGVSLERMLVALYRTNVNQFDGENMNRIRVGKILRQPDQDALMNVTQSEAIQEIHAQASDWNAYRQKLAGAATNRAESATPRQAVSGKITAAAADKTPVASESAKEVLRLSKGETPSDKIASGAAGRAAKAQDHHDAAAEEAIAASKALGEAKTRTALLERNLKDMQRLAELKSEAGALAVSSVAGVEAASAVAATSAVAAASAVKPAPVVEEPSLLDMLMASPLALGIGAAVLLALGGLGVMLGRRKGAVKDSEQPGIEMGADTIGASTGHLTEPVVPSPDTGDFTVGEAGAEIKPAEHEEIDPIGEADLFLNFGRDEQAERVLKDALSHTPDNHQIHLKLLGIYADRKDIEAFLATEDLLQRSGDEEAICQAGVLARKLGLGDASGIEDADSATAIHSQPHFTADELSANAAAMPLDSAVFDVAGESEAADSKAIQEEGLDFDLTENQPVISQVDEVDFDVTATIPSLPVPDMLDFDISSYEPESAVAKKPEEGEVPDLDDLIFDVTAAPEVQPEAQATATEAETGADKTVAQEDNGMEFMLDFPLDEGKEQTAAHVPEINLADISLDMDDIVQPVAAASVDDKLAVADAAPVDAVELYQEVATKIDLARAYQEMGDEIGAREILDEIMLDGDDEQKQQAQLILKQLA